MAAQGERVRQKLVWAAVVVCRNPLGVVQERCAQRKERGLKFEDVV
jgi:hypothetical protein